MCVSIYSIYSASAMELLQYLFIGDFTSKMFILFISVQYFASELDK